ncbi:hypothetical protein HY229_00810 [Candidatus Acetothermia bacterium]|nr:hypothetical protein [Candidatus Acetothermia bacterium]MBI3642631.1 hypothetical protein [Candidatus Acetothermia bacterium]
MSDKILDEKSLAETLWRLEEVRLGFVPAPAKPDVDAALKWLLSRQAGPGSYRERKSASFFAPTASDIESLRLPTGERLTSGASNKHILGEETLRALVLWKKRAEPETRNALAALNEILDENVTRMGLTVTPPRERGYFCCTRCTPAFLRAVSAAKTKGWEETLANGIAGIKKRRSSDGRWRGYPFYYTLLMLSEAESDSARAELKYVRPIAEASLKRYQAKRDRASQFRAYVLQAVLAE